MAVTKFQTVQSFVQFLLNWYLKGGQLVDQATANTRAAICAACHNDLPSSEVRRGCSTCNKMGNVVLNSVRQKIIKNNSTPHDSKLLTCAICGCCLKISVWIPNQMLLKNEDANAYPTHCWKKAILENRDL